MFLAMSFAIKCIYHVIKSSYLTVLLGKTMYRSVALNLLPSYTPPLRMFYNISVPPWRIVNYFFVDLECPGKRRGSNEIIDDVLSLLLLHVSHRVPVKREIYLARSSSMHLQENVMPNIGCYNTLLLCWCCLVSFFQFFSPSQEVGNEQRIL